jgi:Arc/MetJ family transcription regulator
MLSGAAAGLAPIKIDVDDAMLTALVQRFDLMNQRGALADAWRTIKLAGDDLKSVLNLRATQTVSTRADVNRPFDFTFDESQSRFALTLDTPVNRRAQRNAFRGSLIDYQAALRDLIGAGDEIKLAIRNDLRQLQLDREQYTIAVASAALAYERVVSTRLQLNLGVADVATRDFLESQQAYTTSLNAVAALHIGYVVNRIRLFVDLESLEVDENGFWPRLYDEQHQPAPHYQLPPHARPAYGELVPGLWYSRKMKRMLKVPNGQAGVYRDGPTDQQPAQQQPAQLKVPTPVEEIPAPPAAPATKQASRQVRSPAIAKPFGPWRRRAADVSQVKFREQGAGQAKK